MGLHRISKSLRKLVTYYFINRETVERETHEILTIIEYIQIEINISS